MSELGMGPEGIEQANWKAPKDNPDPDVTKTEQPSQTVSENVANVESAAEAGSDGVRELQDRFSDQTFVQELVTAQTRNELKANEQVEKLFNESVNKELKSLQEAMALDEIRVSQGEPYLEMIDAKKKLGKVLWREAVETIEEVRMVLDEQPRQLTLLQARTAIEKQFLMASFRQQLDAAQVMLNEAKRREQIQAEALQAELKERANDPQLLDAMDVWGRSRNAKEEAGSDGRGFNAGAIHYYEYRTDPAKRGRFKGDLDYSLDNFISFSQQLKQLAEHYKSTEDPAIEASVVIGDKLGQQRLFVLTKEQELLIGFQGTGEAQFKILSSTPDVKLKGFQSRVDDSLSGAKEGSRFNILGEEPRTIYDSRT